MPHVLVTGGAGFIGSHLVDAYVERGWRVSVIDNLSTGDRRNLNPKAKLYEAEISEVDLLDEIRPEVVSHHAAQVDVRKSVDDPADDARVNIIGSIRLLQKCADLGVRRFIFASSGGAIYGEPDSVPQTEAHRATPLSPYGCAKLAVEHYMDFFGHVHGLSTVALRYANVYGPRQSSRGEAGVVAIFATRLLRGEECVIHGSGDQTRDFVYVEDVVAANLAVTEHADLRGAYNVGTGVETSVNELYAALAATLHVTRKPRYAAAKAGEQMRSVLDGTRLRTAASLPQPRDLARGLPATVASFAT